MRRKGKSVWNSYSTEYSKADNCLLSSARGTSGDLGHTRQSRYRCSLPGLAGFAGPRCTEPEVPRSGSPAITRLLDKIVAQQFGPVISRLSVRIILLFLHPGESLLTDLPSSP